MEKNDFTPAEVGTDWRSLKQAKDSWEKFTGITSELFDWVLAYTGQDEMTVDEFLSLVSATEPKLVVAKLLVISGKAPLGMKPERLIELGIIDNEFEEEVFTSLNNFNQAKINAESLFRYKVEKLFKDQYFDIDEDFQKELKNHFTVFTKSEEENQALEKLNELCESLNWFADAGIAKTKYGRAGLQTLLLAIGLNEDKTKYAPNRNFFGSLRWKNSFK